MRVNIDTFADVAIFTDVRLFAHMCLSPDARTRADVRVGRYFCGWVNEVRRCLLASYVSMTHVFTSLTTLVQTSSIFQASSIIK